MKPGTVLAGGDTSDEYNPNLDRPQNRTPTRRPSILVSRPTAALAASNFEVVPRIQLLKQVFVLAMSPPIMWGIACLLPLFPPDDSGISLKNMMTIIFFCMTGYLSSFMFKSVFELYYSGMTYGVLFLASSTFSCHVTFVALVTMQLGFYPAPGQSLWLATGWFPCHVLATYFQLKHKGALSGSRGARNTLFRFSLVFLPIFAYFPICGMFSVGMISFNGDPLIQAIVSGGFSLLSRILKGMSMDIVPKLLPRRPPTTGSNDTQHDLAIIEEDSRESKIRLGMFFAFGFCQELFMSMSFSSISDYSSALFMMFLEVAPFLALPLRMTSRFYEVQKLQKGRQQGKVSSLDDYRLMVVELFTLHLLAEICATCGFVILTPILKYGWNSEYFPLRQSCDSEYLTSSGFVISSGTLVMLVGVLNSVWIWKKYGIHAGRVMAAHLRMNGGILFTFSMSMFTFPCALLLRQGNLMYMAVPDAYEDKPPGDCA